MVVKPLGSDVSLPCTAVGFPKPSIVWSGGEGGEGGNSRRWMAEDKPKLLYRISKEAEGVYNCTAYNAYGADWNIVRLKVQGWCFITFLPLSLSLSLFLSLFLSLSLSLSFSLFLRHPYVPYVPRKQFPIRGIFEFSSI